MCNDQNTATDKQPVAALHPDGAAAEFDWDENVTPGLLRTGSPAVTPFLRAPGVTA